MKFKTLLFLLLILPFFASGQAMRGYKSKKSRGGFTTGKKRPRKEYILGIGAANFLGELGGANQIGTHLVKDLEFSTTRPSAALGMRYKFNKRLAVKGGFYYQLVSGADNLTKEPFRKNRNLSFRSNLFELSVQGEFYFTREQTGHLYKIKNARGMKSYDFQAYTFVGFGGLLFNPKANYHGKWVALQPLGTEGEGLPGGPKKYKRVTACIPYGLGMKEGLNKDWSVGMEIGFRYTFSDYIDDVSGKYYDNNAIKAAHGQMAADLADPSLHSMPPDQNGVIAGGWQAAPGSERGNPKYKDAYMFVDFTISYKMPYKRRTRSKF
jgi:hypothetical protein